MQTQQLVQHLVSKNPGLIDEIDWYASQLVQPESESTMTQISSPKRKTSVDPVPFERQVKKILRNTVREWEYGRDDDDISVEVNALVAKALAFVEEGDTTNALVVLQGITEGCAENWHEIEDFCGLTPEDVGLDLDSAWTGVILSADLTTDEILAWQENLESWQDQLGSFAMALEALRQGWDYPPLVRVLQGNITELGAWSGDAPHWADEFSQIRLKILARQQRYEEYLNLADAEGQTRQYLTMLAQLGRFEEAMKTAKTQMTDLVQAKALAETLRSQNQLPQALDIALQGLRLDGDGTHSYNGFEFATWTGDLAEGMDNASAALEARIYAFKARPSYRVYQKIEALAAENWPWVREALLKYLHTANRWGIESAQVDIFLHEGLVEDAMAVASDLGSYQNSLVLKVMDAVMVSHSQWVIDNARRRAESIMDEGKAKYYDNAVEWLKRVKAAYAAGGNGADWSVYYRQLVEQHGRKRKLMGLMQQSQL